MCDVIIMIRMIMTSYKIRGRLYIIARSALVCLPHIPTTTATLQLLLVVAGRGRGRYMMMKIMKMKNGASLKKQTTSGGAAALAHASSSSSSNSSLSCVVLKKKRERVTDEATLPLRMAMREDEKERNARIAHAQWVARWPERKQARVVSTNASLKAEAVRAALRRALATTNWETAVAPSHVMWVDADGMRQRTAVELGPRVEKQRQKQLGMLRRREEEEEKKRRGREEEPTTTKKKRTVMTTTKRTRVDAMMAAEVAGAEVAVGTGVGLELKRKAARDTAARELDLVLGCYLGRGYEKEGETTTTMMG